MSTAASYARQAIRNRHAGVVVGAAKKKSFFSTITDGIRKAWDWASDGVKKLVTTVHDDVKGIIGGVHDDARNIIKGVKQVTVHTEDTVSGIIKEVSHDAKDLGVSVGKDLSQMSWPLAVGAVAVAGVFLLTQKR